MSTPTSIYVFCVASVTLYGSVEGASYYEASAITGNNRRVRSSCQARGGDLATFDSASDVQEIYNLCRATGYPGGGCYLGFNDIQQLNVWRWIDGTPFDGWSWVHSSGFESSSWDRCGAVAVSGTGSYWNSIEDFACDNVPGYGICEYPLDICDCFSISLLSSNVERVSGNQCYQYQVDMCDNLDTVRLGLGNNPNNQCGFRLRDAFVSIEPARLGVTLITSPARLEDRGIVISGLTNGQTFRLCFRGDQVRGTRFGGQVEFDDGEDMDTCGVRNMLPDFCPTIPSTNDDAMFVVNNEGKDTVNTVNKAPMEWMQFVWAALISCIVSMMVVFGAYFMCIKPLNKTVPSYGKVMLDEEEEEEKDVINI